jgi:hypothetical protein
MSEYAGRYITQWSEVATQNTNAAATATKAGVANQRHFITGYSVSCSAAPGTAVSVTITDGATTVERVELPAAAFSPIVVNFGAPVRCGINAAAEITCPAVGGTTRSTVVLRGFTLYQ